VWKIVFILLILLGAALYFPQTRPTVTRYLAPVINPVLTWQTRGEMGQISRELETLHSQGSNIPTPGAAFQRWIDRRFMGGSKTDGWGNDYTLKVWRDSIGIISSGPDKTLDTSDDIKHRVDIPVNRLNR
jgi:hypothetical protein